MFKRPTIWLTMGLSAALACGCGSDDAAAEADGGGVPAGGSDGEGGQGGNTGGAVTGGTASEPDAALPTGNFPQDGLWALTVNVVEFTLKLPFQIEVSGTEGTRTLDSVVLRAVGADGVTLSDPLATAMDVAVAADGAFKFGFENITLPGAYTPTGSDVEVTINFDGTATGETAMCGTVTGRVVTLETDLTMSAFGAVPWETPADQRPFSCDPVVEQQLTPIDPADCPALVEGENAAFPSAGLERTFRLFVPATWSADKKYPLIFMWHGLGQTQDEIQADSNFEALVDDNEILLVVPDSQVPKPGVEWDQLAIGENPDLVFFDDMLTCVDKGYGVDPDRVHSSGLSAGALWTTYLTMFRSETIASSVAFSGGLLVEYPMPAATRPMIVAWGGDDDIAFDQNFTTLAHDLLGDILPAGHFALACNHGQGHEWMSEFTPWALKFLLDHPRTLVDEPYAAGIPEGFPEYCVIATEP